MSQVQLGSLALFLPLGVNGGGMNVEFSDIVIASKTLSAQKIRMLEMDDIIRKRLYQLAERAETLPGLRCVLQSGGDVLLCHDIFLLKDKIVVRQGLFV